MKGIDGMRSVDAVVNVNAGVSVVAMSRSVMYGGEI